MCPLLEINYHYREKKAKVAMGKSVEVVEAEENSAFFVPNADSSRLITLAVSLAGLACLTSFGFQRPANLSCLPQMPAVMGGNHQEARSHSESKHFDEWVLEAYPVQIQLLAFMDQTPYLFMRGK